MGKCRALDAGNDLFCYHGSASPWLVIREHGPLNCSDWGRADNTSLDLGLKGHSESGRCQPGSAAATASRVNLSSICRYKPEDDGRWMGDERWVKCCIAAMPIGTTSASC